MVLIREINMEFRAYAPNGMFAPIPKAPGGVGMPSKILYESKVIS
jgi:hypothetical protein